METSPVDQGQKSCMQDFYTHPQKGGVEGAYLSQSKTWENTEKK